MTRSGVPILTLILLVPLLGALLIAVLPRHRHDLIRGRGAGRGAARLRPLARRCWPPSTRRHPASVASSFVESVPWIPAFGIEYTVGIDGISLVLVVLTTLLTWISILASFRPINERVKEYMISFLVLEVGMLGVFMALDLFLFYVFWEIVLVPMYLIIGIWGGPNRIYATIKFVLYTLIGSLLMLVAILATALRLPVGDGQLGRRLRLPDAARLRLRHDAPGGLPSWPSSWPSPSRCPMWPFHTWLPDAHVEAPTAGSVILAGVLLKLGGYGFIRFALPLFPQAAQTCAPLIVVLSLIAIIYGAIVADRPARPQEAGRLQLGQPHGLRDAGHLRLPAAGHGRGRPADGQPRPHHRRPLPVRRASSTSGRTTGPSRKHGRPGGPHAGLRRASSASSCWPASGCPAWPASSVSSWSSLGTFAVCPLAAAIATLVMVLGAVYLLWMFQRVVFGDAVRVPAQRRAPSHGPDRDRDADAGAAGRR